MKLGAILLAGVTAIAPVVAGHAWADIATPIPGARFAPPTIPLMLSRTVIRELSDGQRIAVMRRYKVQFVPAGDGFLLNGELVEVQVDAPPMLASFAAMERQRADSQMFPFVLSAQGLLQPQVGHDEIAPQARAQLTTAATGLIAGSKLSAQHKTEGAGLATQMANASPYSQWPSDLFVAIDPERHQRRTVALPGGGQGEVDVMIRVSNLLPCGMPGLVERTITTLAQGTQRVSREVWTVAYTTPYES